MGASTLKEMARARTVKVGHFIVEFVTPGIGHLLKNAGCDYVLFDTEHSGFHNETIKSAIRYFEAADLPVIVRVPSKHYHDISRALDMGAEGIMVPMVNDAEEAEAIVRSMKYTPRGGRGVALAVAHDNYMAGDVMKKLQAANDRTTLFVQIETAAGVENAEAIAAVDGVDCLWVGHFDLSSSLGIPGRFGHPKFKRAVETTYEACRKHKKAYGRLVPDVKSGLEMFNEEGFDFICYAGDVWVFQAAVQEGVSSIRAGCKGQAGRKTGGKARKPAGKRKARTAG
ncbi:MAG TPA: aldolase/citrate lyase family protein [Afifellaceae bacterium]|nr:aldolase/citrate lyase family protein [Afifellaceae bacterium]